MSSVGHEPRAASVVLSERMVDLQSGWLRCERCECLVHESVPGGQTCGAQDMLNWIGGYGSPSHMFSSTRYVVPMSDDPAEGQPGWRWCSGCSALYHERKHGAPCPARARVVEVVDNRPVLAWDPHISSQSAHYCVRVEGGPHGGTRGWRWCRRCGALVLSKDGANSGVCHDKWPHDFSRSGMYMVEVEKTLLTRVR